MRPLSEQQIETIESFLKTDKHGKIPDRDHDRIMLETDGGATLGPNGYRVFASSISGDYTYAIYRANDNSLYIFTMSVGNLVCFCGCGCGDTPHTP